MPSERFKVGDSVMAKWPGSSLYYRAKVRETFEKEYTVLFEEGTEYTINEKFIKVSRAPIFQLVL